MRTLSREDANDHQGHGPKLVKGLKLGDPFPCSWIQQNQIPCELILLSWASLVAQLVKNPPAMWETWVRSLVWEDPFSPGEGNSYPLQYSDLENSVDCIVHGVTNSQAQLSNFHLHFVDQSKDIQWTHGRGIVKDQRAWNSIAYLHSLIHANIFKCLLYTTLSIQRWK